MYLYVQSICQKPLIYLYKLLYTESKYGGPHGWHGTSFTKARLVRHRSQSFSHIYSGCKAISTAINCITMHKCT